MHEQVEAVLKGGEHDAGHKLATPDNIRAIYEVVEAAKRIIDGLSAFGTPEVSFEARVQCGEFDPVADEVFGTADLVIYSPDDRLLAVIDYKFGHGEVDVRDNGQLMLYAMAAAGRYPDAVEVVELHVLQPASGQIDKTVTYRWAEMLQWWHDVAAPAIVMATDPEPPIVPGEVQCRWCPLSGSCPAQRGKMIDALATVDTLPAVQQEMPLERVLAVLPEIETWIKGVRATAIAKLERGESVPGYKLVEGRTHRKWVDDAQAEKWLAARKLSKDERTETKVISIAQAEKKLTALLKDNTRLRNAFDKLVDKPAGAPTLALESDKRPAITRQDPFQEEFSEAI
jgi:hypothetical protein